MYLHGSLFIEVILSPLHWIHALYAQFYSCKTGPVCELCGELIAIKDILCSWTKLVKYKKIHFPQFSDEHIPFHPSLLFGENSLIKVSCVASFLKEAEFLRLL